MQKHERPTRECCDEHDCKSGLKNNFFEGKRLTPDMFRVEQRYQIERRRLLNRAVHGWGVVYGFGLKVEQAKEPGREARLVVGGGFALDQCGRELVEADRQTIDLSQVILVDDQGKRTTFEEQNKFLTPDERRTGSCWLLSAHYAERLLDSVRVSDPCECNRCEWEHTCETVRYTLRRVDCDDCCAPFPCELECGCNAGWCCTKKQEDGRTVPKEALPDIAGTTAHANVTASAFEAPPRLADGPREDMADMFERKLGDFGDAREDVLANLKKDASTQKFQFPNPPPAFRRGGCSCLCLHLTKLRPGEGCEELACEIEEPCARVRVDLKHGVPLACVRIGPGRCEDWALADIIDACGPRRLVKRNDMLFDLIRGCDLTRIVTIAWRHWHRKTISFDEFDKGFAPPQVPGQRQAEYRGSRFAVAFTRPVQKKTFLPDCFSITVLSHEWEGRWWEPWRVPISRLEYIPMPDDPDLVIGAFVMLEGGWVEDALRGSGSRFRYDTIVEIEVRGDFILDCNGQPVDANPVGLLHSPSGNGTPGGSFFSTFRVTAREEDRAQQRTTSTTGA